MNTHLLLAEIKRPGKAPEGLDNTTVRGASIRYVILPDVVNLGTLLEGDSPRKARVPQGEWKEEKNMKPKLFQQTKFQMRPRRPREAPSSRGGRSRRRAPGRAAPFLDGKGAPERMPPSPWPARLAPIPRHRRGPTERPEAARADDPRSPGRVAARPADAFPCRELAETQTAPSSHSRAPAPDTGTGIEDCTRRDPRPLNRRGPTPQPQGLAVPRQDGRAPDAAAKLRRHAPGRAGSAARAGS